MWALALCVSTLSGQPRGVSEQELRAAALNQLVQFARWPAETMKNDQQPFIIGIYGEDPFGSIIDDLTRGENVNGHAILVQRVFTIEEAEKCHVLYVAGANRRSADHVIHAVATKGVLTVTDDEAVVDEGAVIGLTLRNHRIHLLVNLEAARRDGLTLSSKLLRLAEIVKP